MSSPLLSFVGIWIIVGALYLHRQGFTNLLYCCLAAQIGNIGIANHLKLKASHYGVDYVGLPLWSRKHLHTFRCSIFMQRLDFPPSKKGFLLFISIERDPLVETPLNRITALVIGLAVFGFGMSSSWGERLD